LGPLGPFPTLKVNDRSQQIQTRLEGKRLCLFYVSTVDFVGVNFRVIITSNDQLTDGGFAGGLPPNAPVEGS
jgi:hypothetical protein